MDAATHATAAPTATPSRRSHAERASAFRTYRPSSLWVKNCGRKVWAVWLMTSRNGLTKKKRLRTIWWAARVASPGRAAATCVITPKAAIFPIMRVRTGAAKARKDLDDTFPSGNFSTASFLPPGAKSSLRAGRSMAAVPANCARRVAMAAPAVPMPLWHTRNRSPKTFTRVVATVATRGVTESLAPRSAAWRTPANRVVGMLKARMRTYSAAGSRMCVSDTSPPMYTPRSVRPDLSRSATRKAPQISAILEAVRTTPSPAILGSTASFLLDAFRAMADAYRLVVATFRNAKRYVEPSMKVVAGPSAPSCMAPVPSAALSPMEAVSTRERRGPDTHRARQGM
mmetsp:Transcript_35012/g.104420  ORF Transcript_35012/g.104420 Transcript_35012/m.104420 type:complete len:342 (-) Transcript_35012:546-1571(-)